MKEREKDRHLLDQIGLGFFGGGWLIKESGIKRSYEL